MSGTQLTTGTERELVLDFDHIDAGMVAVVGGKAANLGVLTKAELPVPQGFCVTTEAYRRVVTSTAMDDLLVLLSAAPTRDLAALGELAGRARAFVAAADVPDDIADAVRTAYTRLGADVAVAVRSSATAEDLEFASFAGQQDTYLNVVGVDAVLDAVRRCWASLWTDRAVAYRATNGIDHRVVTLAVVVQRMVDVRTAGVLFTANPVTGRRNEAVIDASPGLGEAVVSGAVNPDHFVVDTATGEITERRLGDKKLLIRALPGGGTEQVELPADDQRACLTDEQVKALAELGRNVEVHYGSPQDTEWAIDVDGKLWLTQARPITTLFPVPASRMRGPDPHVYLCLSLAQGLTRPITPMGMAGFRMLGTSIARNVRLDITDPLAGPPAFVEAGQRAYVDMSRVIRSGIGREVAPRIFGVMETRSAAVIRHLMEDPRFEVTQEFLWPLVKRVAPLALRMGVPFHVIGAIFRPAAAGRRIEKLGRQLAERLVVPDSASPRERLDHAERILANHIFPVLPRTLPAPAAGFAMLGLARKLLRGLVDGKDLQSVLRGLPNNVTTEMDLELWALTTKLRADAESAAAFRDSAVTELVERYRAGTLPPVAQTGLRSFLDSYGHRAVAEIDLGMPRWSDDPTHIVGVLANYQRLDDPDLAPDAMFARGVVEAEETIESLVRTARSKGRLRARLVRTSLRRARQLGGFREQPKYFLIVGLAAVRRQIGLVGEELAAAGRIDAADDVFFLDLADARRGLGGADLHELVAERRAAYDLELRRRHVPRLLLSDGTEPETQLSAGAAVEEGTLVGSPASAGLVTGPARVVLDPVGAHLEPGEILVAPSTDPGWTPLFLTAGGLVMEMGGANSHGAVVAREYGIPAVVGVPDATSQIVTGQVITVDGAAGTITPGV